MDSIKRFVWVTCGTTDVDHQVPIERTMLVLGGILDELWWPCPDCRNGHVTDLTRLQVSLLQQHDIPTVDLSVDADAELRELTR